MEPLLYANFKSAMKIYGHCVSQKRISCLSCVKRFSSETGIIKNIQGDPKSVSQNGFLTFKPKNDPSKYIRSTSHRNKTLNYLSKVCNHEETSLLEHFLGLKIGNCSHPFFRKFTFYLNVIDCPLMNFTCSQ